MTAFNTSPPLKNLAIFLAFSLVSVLCVWFEPSIGITGIVLLYLMFVVLVAYSASKTIAWLITALAFLTINFLFISPRYTFQIYELSSWIMLAVFLGVTVVITSVLHRLQQQRFSAEIAQAQALFGQRIAEALSKAESVHQADTTVATALNHFTQKPIVFFDNTLQTLATAPEHTMIPSHNAIQHVLHTGQTVYPVGGHAGASTLVMPIEAVPQAALIMQVGELTTPEFVRYSPVFRLAMQQLSETRKRIMAQDIRKASERRADEERIKSALLSSIAHDMRTPLTVILGAANTLEQQTLTPTQTRDLLSVIQHQTNYLNQTTENILSLVRIESALTIPMSIESVEELISLVMQHYTYRNTKPEITLGTLASECFIQANAGLVVQAIVNLIENAINASSAQSNPITLSVEKFDRRIAIEVRDDGSGLSTEAIQCLDKFDENTQSKRNGLGVSIVNAIMAKHAGTFTLSNAEGGGASAVLTFPAFDLPPLEETTH